MIKKNRGFDYSERRKLGEDELNWLISTSHSKCIEYIVRKYDRFEYVNMETIMNITTTYLCQELFWNINELSIRDLHLLRMSLNIKHIFQNSL